MTFSKLRIRFTEDWQLGYELFITKSENSIVSVLEAWQWVTLRSNPYEVTLGVNTGNVGERSAIAFKEAFDLDNPTGYITTIENTNEILIESETEGENFVAANTGNQNIGSLEAEIDNYIPLVGAYLLKYYINYCDDFNVNRSVSVLEKDYTGGAFELMADTNPINITYESSSDFKFSPVRPSTAEIYMIFNTETGVDFEEFWTADEKQFKVEERQDNAITWAGYFIPDGFQYEFKGGLYYATVTASDGLGGLEAIPFIDDNQKPYGNQNLVYNNGFSFPFILIATEILRKLDLDLDLWVCVDSYEKTMLKTGDVREAEPLANTFVNVKTYIKENEDSDVPYWFGSGEVWNCYEVIENLLYIFGAKLYQEGGVWRIKAINADVDYGTGETQRYWRKYNTVATYLGNYEAINDTINIPCNNDSKFLLGSDHVMRMDDVYKLFRINYEYTFIREGDSLLDLLPNVGFCDFENNYTFASPSGWSRWALTGKWYMRLKDITIPPTDAGGYECGIEIGTQQTGIPLESGSRKTDPNPAIWTGLRVTGIDVVKNQDILFKTWAKYRFISPDNTVDYAPVFKCALLSENDDLYYLRNTYINNDYNLVWEKIENKTASSFSFAYDIFEFFLAATDSENFDVTERNDYKWYEFVRKIEPVPTAGELRFSIQGLGASRGRSSSNFVSFYVWKQSGASESLGELKIVSRDWIDQGGDIPRLQLTGVSLGIIPLESELPSKYDYVYENTNPTYSLQVDPITIYNGDLQDEKHVSNITVPTNTGGGKNFWDDLSNSFGYSSLGLLTTKQIMRQYDKPYRVLEGDLKIQNPKFGATYTFEAQPNVTFVLQRGSFNRQKQFIENATFVQVNENILPDGGSEGGNTLDPIWIPTGNTYCQIGEDGLNTGVVIIQEIDNNPNSETFGETREVSGGNNLEACPLSQPRLYYWGSNDVFLNPNELQFTPFEQADVKTIQVSFNNIDGNYLYFVHLKSLGLVERIYTNTSPNNVISDWVYLDDVIINGYLYRVLRTDYVMAEFSNFTHNFQFV